jgi:hypothetical protein
MTTHTYTHAYISLIYVCIYIHTRTHMHEPTTHTHTHPHEYTEEKKKQIHTRIHMHAWIRLYLQDWDNDVETPDSSDLEGVEPQSAGFDEGDCCVCRVGGFLVSCDGGCNRDFCMGCSGIGNPGNLPRGPWLCTDCVHERVPVNRSVARGSNNAGHRGSGTLQAASRSRREDVIVLDDDDDDEDDFIVDDSDIRGDDNVTSTRRRGGRLMLTRRSGHVGGRGGVRSTNSEVSSTSAQSRGGGARSGAGSGLSTGRGNSSAAASRRAPENDDSTRGTSVVSRDANQGQETRGEQVRRMMPTLQEYLHACTQHMKHMSMHS